MPRMMEQRRQGFRAPRSSFWVEISRTDGSTAAPPANQWSYWLSEYLAKEAGVCGTHCHLDFTSNKLGHGGTFAKFRFDHPDTSPSDWYAGYIAHFCNPGLLHAGALGDHDRQRG